MSEQTSIYIHKASEKILPYVPFDNEKYRGADKEVYVAAMNEHDKYIRDMYASYGLMLMYLCTTPSRRLHEYIPYNEDGAKPFTKEMLDDVIEFYNDDINELNEAKKRYLEKIDELNSRFKEVTSKEVYDAISNDIDEYKSYIVELDEDIDDATYFLGKFEMVKNIMEINDGDGYELLYTRC